MKGQTSPIHQSVLTEVHELAMGSDSKEKLVNYTI